MFFSLLFFGIICRYNFSIKLSPIFIILGTTPSRIDFIPTGCPPMGDKRYTRSFQSKDSTIFLIVSQSTLDNQIQMRSGQKYVGLKIEIYFSRMQQLFLEAHLHQESGFNITGSHRLKKMHISLSLDILCNPLQFLRQVCHENRV